MEAEAQAAKRSEDAKAQLQQRVKQHFARLVSEGASATDAAAKAIELATNTSTNQEEAPKKKA